MIKTLFSDAIICEDFVPSGVSNVIQTAAASDIIFVRSKSQSQLNSLIELNLPHDFKGLIVSPYIPSRLGLNYCVSSLSEMTVLEGKLIEKFYPKPSRDIHIIGVTGTNGKTSSCWYMMEIGRVLGYRVLYMGTIGVYLNGKKKEDKILTTTPSLLSLRKLQSKYAKEVDIIAIEVSSHALEQERIKGISFDVVAWTNFTQDHLDFHKDMQAYFNAKLKIVNYSRNKELIVAREEIELIKKVGESATIVKTIDLSMVSDQIPKMLKKGFSRKNIEMALTCLDKLVGVKTSLDLEKLVPPPGRFEVIEKQATTFIIDYAHTPDALEKVLNQIRGLFPEHVVISVFGCGGDRDKSKRSLMLKAALANSDQVFVTSDNPRTESPDKIIEDITSGASGFYIQSDRKKAILAAYENATQRSDGKKSIVLIAGKGDENYQEMNGIRHAYSDAAVVMELS